MTALTKTPQITLSEAPSRPRPGLYNPSGWIQRLPASPLFAIGPSEPGPALRRGFLLAVPVAVTLVVELGFGAPTKGALGAGAMICGFAGMDAPARPRAAWQAVTAVLIGVAAAIGVLSSQHAVTAVLAMGVLGALAGYGFAVSLRFAISGLCMVLGLMIAQGLWLPVADADEALLWGVAGSAIQVLWSLLVWVFYDRAADQPESGWDTRRVLDGLRSNLNLESHAARHALRFGAALAAGVAVYRLAGFHDHGYWVPLTICFVMRPERDESYHRIVLRAAGTAVGLVIATALAEVVDSDLLDGVLLAFAAAFAFGLLTVQYALFTTAITVFIVLLTDTLGEPALEAAGQRALGTAVGLAIIFLAFVLWPNREGPRRREEPEAAAPA
ncbi:MAG TPA: FUSC family protein [Solirubrobacterales bacterium]|nr:FUSC family protein [Solirubrobacterales bacterium]